MRLIRTEHVYPPIPIRSCDWCAYFDGEEEAGNYGWGSTEQEAINDLMERRKYMAGAICWKCYRSTNDATVPQCSDEKCPGHATFTMMHALKKPDTCSHDFQGWRDVRNAQGRIIGGEMVCSKCGIGAMEHGWRYGD